MPEPHAADSGLPVTSTLDFRKTLPLMRSLKLYGLGGIVSLSLASIPGLYGIFAWMFFVFQFSHPIINSPGGHDEGSNNLAAGIGIVIYYGFIIFGAFVAMIASLIARRVTGYPISKTILSFASIANGVLIGAAILVILCLICYAKAK